MERQTYKPMNKDEKLKFVAQGEQRIGSKYFIGFAAENAINIEHKVVHVTKTLILEEDIEAPSLYKDLFYEAISRLGQNKNTI